MFCDCASCNGSINAKDLVEKLLSAKIIIKKSELGLSKEQFIENRKIAREKEYEKAHKKMLVDMEAAMNRISERFLMMKNIKKTEEEEEKPWKVGR